MLDVAKMAHESWTAGAADAGRFVIGSQGLVASGECHCRSRRQIGVLGEVCRCFHCLEAKKLSQNVNRSFFPLSSCPVDAAIVSRGPRAYFQDLVSLLCVIALNPIRCKSDPITEVETSASKTTATRTRDIPHPPPPLLLC